MTTSELVYQFGQERFVGRLAVPNEASADAAAVLVFHEAPGISAHSIRVVERLADSGYIALAADYIGDGRLLEGAEVGEVLGALGTDPDRMRALGQAGLEALRECAGVDPSRIAVIGYCFGGTMALELARSGADIKALMGFHCGLTSARPEDSRHITGSVVVYIGADDPYVPAEQRAAFADEMTAAGIDWRLVLHGGIVHSFTNADTDSATYPGVAYDQRADRRSWAAMRDLFAETIDLPK